jgi:hypothetical protein
MIGFRRKPQPAGAETGAAEGGYWAGGTVSVTEIQGLLAGPSAGSNE